MRLLNSYCSRWNRFDQVEEKTLVKPLSGDSALEMELGHLTCTTKSGPRIDDTRFMRVPSGSAGSAQEGWIIHGIPSVAYATHPPSDLLAVLQVVDEERSVETHRHATATMLNRRIGYSKFTCCR